ncbi:MAG: hypothetical protein JNG90_16145, partial [Planctomycetaceae bacterium]|nr:hypothetical protein [Planctomycetaceae bacterium]
MQRTAGAVFTADHAGAKPARQGLRRARRAASLALAAVLAGAILAAQPAWGLDPSRRLVQCLHRIWQLQQGLPQATIYAIRQTSDGYLWLGTPNGVARFDGVRFTVLRELGGISLEKIRVLALVEDAQQNLWLGTDGAGLICLAGADFRRPVKQLRQAEGLPADSIHALFADRRGDLWIGTTHGVARLHAGEVTVLHDGESLPPGTIRALGEAADGSIWIGGDGHRLGRWDGTRCVPHVLETLPAETTVRALLPAEGSGMWVGTSDGLVRTEGEREQRFAGNDGLADDYVYCLAAGSNDSLWIGTKAGFSRLHGGEFDSFLPQDGLSQSTVYALCEDREGSLWVGTKHGLNQFADRRTIPFTVREGLPSNDVGPLLQDTAGNIWVGTLGAGLAQYDGKTFQVLTTRDGLASNRIAALARGAANELWVGTDQGLNLLRAGAVAATYTTDQGLPASSVRAILRNSRGELWVGTSRGLARLDGDRFVVPGGDEGPARQPIHALAEHQGSLLIATTAGGGLYRYADDRFTALLGDAIAARDIDALYVDAEGLVWIGTQTAGLILVDDQRVTTFSPADGLYDDAIYGIAADEQGRLWMACSKGIFSVARADLLSFAAGRRSRLEYLPFTPTDGQRTIECRGDVQPAVWRMQDGRLWFATIHGLIVLDPHHLRIPLPPAPVVIEELIVNGTSRSPTDRAPMPRGANNISFRYAALSFRSPARLSFQYRLEGFDQDWVDAGTRREAIYTNLPPGRYRFRVLARNLEDRPSEAPAPVEFTLRPHFYQARWFLPLCLGAVGGAAWFGYRWRVRWIKSRLQAIATERSRIARELHDTLMQGFSGVTMEMQALLTRLPPSPNRDALQEIIGDAGNCLREARRSIAGLRSAPGQETGLAAALAQTARQLTDAAGLRLKLAVPHSPSRLPASVEYDLLRIAQEALVNAVKHAQASSIEVQLEYEPRAVR